MENPALKELNQAQLERLAFLDFRLYFLGSVGRPHICDRFGVVPMVASRDLASYQDAAPKNTRFDGKRKLYIPSDDFKPLFNHEPERVLSALSKGFGEGIGKAASGFLACESPVKLNLPSLPVLAIITRAIHQRDAVRLTYHSLKSGTSKREVVPHALVDSGQRWHVRCFDRKSKEFRDLVLTRVEKPSLIGGGDIATHEQADKDFQWGRIVEMELVPHPNHPYPDLIAKDYGLKGGRTIALVRAALAGYTLLQLSVDCTTDHCLDPSRFRLWLKNSDKLLYGVSSAVLAPGYERILTNFTDNGVICMA
jgi:hypothetical protein